VTGAPQEIPLRLIDGLAAPNDAADDRSDLPSQVGAADELSANLERELNAVIDQEADTARKLDTRRTRRAVLEQQLSEAREETARLAIEKALAARNAMLIESEEMVAARRIEAIEIIDQARQQADDILAGAERESTAIVDEGRERLRALEEDAVLRATQLDSKHKALTGRLQVMETLYDELQATLKLVAETSIQDLGASQRSLRQLDATHPSAEDPSARVFDGMQSPNRDYPEPVAGSDPRGG